jgi:6-phosphogluconolactonase
VSDTHRPTVVICRDADELSARAADLLVEAARDSVRERGRFALALAGGSTPEKAYALLAGPGAVARVDWSKAHLFFGDERFVPPDDPRSNYAMVRRSLLAGAPVPPAQVFPVPTDRPTPADSASAYSATLAEAFGLLPGGAPPSFDLVLLGLGEDGHTASLFPGAAALAETRTWVTWSPPGVLPPPVDRVTLTFPVLNAACRVLFLVSGANKAPALRDVLEGGALPQVRPAAGVRPAGGTLTWLVDSAAAGLLTSR